MERITEILCEAYRQMLLKVGPYVQVVSVCDDLATQLGPMISPEIYRKRIKPLQKRLIEVIKAHSQASVFYHGCGATRVFLPT